MHTNLPIDIRKTPIENPIEKELAERMVNPSDETIEIVNYKIHSKLNDLTIMFSIKAKFVNNV